MDALRFATLALWSVALAAATVGCASSSSVERPNERADRRESESGDERTPQAPKPDTLEESPCGDPNWARMPDQHKIDGDRETSSEQRGPAEENRASENDEESRDASPDDDPSEETSPDDEKTGDEDER